MPIASSWKIIKSFCRRYVNSHSYITESLVSTHLMWIHALADKTPPMQNGYSSKTKSWRYSYSDQLSQIKCGLLYSTHIVKWSYICNWREYLIIWKSIGHWYNNGQYMGMQLGKRNIWTGNILQACQRSNLSHWRTWRGVRKEESSLSLEKFWQKHFCVTYQKYSGIGHVIVRAPYPLETIKEHH